MSKKIYLYLAKIPEDLSRDNAQHPCNLSPKASEKRFREFFTSRELIKFALDTDWRVVEHDDRPPSIHNSNNSQTRSLSISHSNDWTAVAIGSSDIELGVDIELIRENWTVEKAKFFCSPDELKKGFTLPKTEQNKYFTLIWTQKEAFYKATQQTFVAKKFEGDSRITSSEPFDNYLYSVFSNPVTELKVEVVKLNIGKTLVKLR